MGHLKAASVLAILGIFLLLLLVLAGGGRAGRSFAGGLDERADADLPPCTIFVSHEGTDDARCGGANVPCGSFEEALTKAHSEGSVICMVGSPTPYPCPATSFYGLNITVSRLVIRSFGGNAEFYCEESSGAVFSLNPWQSITFAGLVMNGDPIWIEAGQNLGGAKADSEMQLRIENCTLIGSGGIQLWGAADVVIKGCRFCNSSISISGADRVHIESSDFYHTPSEFLSDKTLRIDSSHFEANFSNPYTTVMNVYPNQYSLTSITQSTFSQHPVAIWVNENNTVITFKENDMASNYLALLVSSVFAGTNPEAVPVNIRCEIEGGTFRDNVIALQIQYTPENVDHSFQFANFSQTQQRGWVYTGNVNTIKDVQFINNSGWCDLCIGIGAAIFLQYGQTYLHNCTFQNNNASMYGGAIGIAGASTALTVTGCKFVKNSAVYGGKDIYSIASGNLVINETSFDVHESPQSFLEVPQGGTVVVEHNNITCAAGSQFESPGLKPLQVILSPWGLVDVTVTKLSCSPCIPGTYNLAHGGRLFDGTQINITCHPCPGEADCSRGGGDVESLPGYWCGQKEDDESMLECTPCPPGFCFTDLPHAWNEMCSGNRDGVLCGECRHGFQEAFATEECVHQGECNAYWFIPVALLVGFLYVLLLVAFPVSDHPLWKSVTYFLQVIPLIASLDNQILVGILAVFALDFSKFGAQVGVCPWDGLTSVDKTVADYIIPIVLLLELALVASIHRLFRFLPGTDKLVHSIRYFVRGAPQREHHDHGGHEVEYMGIDGKDAEDEDEEVLEVHEHPYSEYARYSSAVAGLVLLFYEGVTSATFELLQCVELGSGLRLFIVGEIECYTGWQYFLFVVVALFLLPFPLFLVPLRMFLKWKWGPNPHAHAIAEVLEEPYSRNRKWWESVGMLRRLVLLSISVFVPDPIWRSLLLFGGCVLVHQSHVFFKPFATRLYSRVEAGFLFTLTIIAALQIPHAVYVYLGVSDSESATYLALSIIELILILLPLTICLIFFVWVHGKSGIRCAIRRWRQYRQPPQHRKETGRGSEVEIPLQEGKRGVKNLDLIVPLMGEEDSSDLRLSATNKTHQADSASARRGTSGSD